MLVYRIENAEGRGPWYCYGTGRYNDHKSHGHDAGEPPGPHSDGERGTPLFEMFRTQDRDDYYFGFRSKTQLVKWFQSRDGRVAMRDVGFRVSIYSVPEHHVARGNWQLAFKRSEAQLVSQLDLETLH